MRKKRKEIYKNLPATVQPNAYPSHVNTMLQSRSHLFDSMVPPVELRVLFESPSFWWSAAERTRDQPISLNFLIIK